MRNFFVTTVPCRFLTFFLLISFLLPTSLLAQTLENTASFQEQQTADLIPLYFFLAHSTTTAYGILGVTPITDELFAWAYVPFEKRVPLDVFDLTVTGATQSSPLDAYDSANGYATTPNATTTTLTANDLVTATLSRFSTTAATTNRTEIYNSTASSTLGAASYQLATTAGSYSDTYTPSTAADWSMSMAAFKPAGGTGSTTTYFIHTDHLRGTNVVTDEDGTLAQELDYLPFGEVRVDQRYAGFDESRKYIGQYYDEDTALSYLNARYYDGARGQFTSQDPTHLAIGDPGQIQEITGGSLQKLLADPQLLNSYSYARNNPIVNKDPDGKYLESGFDVAMLGLSLYQFSQDPSWTNAGAVFLDAGSLALPGVPAVGGMALRTGKVADNVASLIAKNRAAGALGEQAAGIIKNTEKIPSLTKPGTSRIPDILDHGAKSIGDVKNTNYQPFTAQLRDIYTHAQNISYNFKLIVDQRTQISNTLKQLGNQIEIIRKSLNEIKKSK